MALAEQSQPTNWVPRPILAPSTPVSVLSTALASHAASGIRSLFSSNHSPALSGACRRGELHQRTLALLAMSRATALAQARSSLSTKAVLWLVNEVTAMQMLAILS